jgi:hypothetical protein
MATARPTIVPLNRDARPEPTASLLPGIALPEEETAVRESPGVSGNDGTRVPFSLVLLRPSGGVLLWAGSLTPYLVQTIIRNALRAGRGSHVFVTLTPDASDGEVEGVTRRLASLRGRGVRVTISRGVESTLRHLGLEPARSPGAA